MGYFKGKQFKIPHILFSYAHFLYSLASLKNSTPKYICSIIHNIVKSILVTLKKICYYTYIRIKNIYSP